MPIRRTCAVRRAGRRMAQAMYLAAVVSMALWCSLAQPAGATGRLGFAPASTGLEPARSELARVCPASTSTTAECLSAIDPTSAAPSAPATASASPASCFVGENEYCGAGLSHGFSAQDLQSAYKLPSVTGGSGQTVAIVDAYDDPNAQADLNGYRSTYGLPPCESGCFSKVNQTGGTTYPAPDAGWALEISLDVDMVSAACPNCHIVLVEATNNTFENLGIAENEAASLGATEISNSYAANELLVGKKAVEEDGTKYYTHASIPMTVASGDNSYDNTNPCFDENEKCLYVAPNYPAGLASVVSVGGTNLHPEGETGRGWKESVWFQSGSGCTLYIAKPAWQTDKGCANRTDNDVAAEASPTTPVSVYDTYATVVPGWQLVGGTSASAPLMAGAIALETSTLRGEGSAGIYAHLGNWFDVTEGINYPAPREKCPSEYLCTGKVGYDGPSGVGTPNGGASTTPPSAVTEGAAEVTRTSATLNAIVNPEASATTYYFQYGGSSAYTYGEVPLGGTKTSTYTKPTVVSQAISGLQPASVYHYRIVAKSTGGTTYGADRMFSTAPKVYLSKFGSKGTTEGAFESPQGVATDVQGNIWVSDYLNNRIEKFSSSGTFLKACGSKGSGGGQFNGPTGIAVNPASDGLRGGYVYVSDSGNGRVEVFSPECKYTETIGKPGSSNGALSNPMGLAFGFDGTHYYRQPPVLAVADSGNNRLEEFTWQVNNAQYKAGEYFASYGSAGSGEGQFLSPTGVALIGSEHPETEQFAIVDSGNNRIQEIEEEEITALHEKVSFKHVRQFGSKGSGEGQLSSPTAIAIDATTGDLNVTDTGNNSIEQFLPNGTYVARFGSAGSGNESFQAPKGITMTTSGILYVGDSGNNRVDSWQPSQEAHPQWAITSTPNPVNTLNAYLWGTSCTTSLTCTAVGQYESNGTNNKPVPLAERWNGTEWAIQTTPYLGEPKQAILYSVACASATSCIAVGFNESSSGTYFSLSESWNGTEWKVKTTPEPTGTLNSLLDGVSCSSASACTAIGYYENSSGVELPFAERWNGTEWTGQSMPAPTGAKATNPSGVSCPSASACTAGGYYTNSSGVRVPFAEAWNGTSWAVQSVPNPSTSKRTEVRGISCTSSTACTMVGVYETTAVYRVPFAARWNGTAWAEQSVPSPSGTKYNSLDAVSCASSAACTAVGVSFSNASQSVTLAEHWNGTEWTVQPTPNNEKDEGWLSGGVSCPSLTMCAAVGNTGKTFAEIYR
jgi:hypothetical protein